MSDEATFTMTLAGREIAFRRSNLGQILMLQRTAFRAIQRAEDDGDDGARVETVSRAMIKVLDFIDKLVVNEDDRQFIEDQVLEGTITWDELMRALSGGHGDEQEDDQLPKPTKRAPRKSPKAAPAKAVANRGRTKR